MQPIYQVRVPEDLYHRLREAGSAKVREALALAFPVTQQDVTQPVIQPVTQKAKRVTTKRVTQAPVTQVVTQDPEPVTQSVIQDKPALSMAEKIAASRERIAQEKERKDAERREREGAKVQP